MRIECILEQGGEKDMISESYTEYSTEHLRGHPSLGLSAPVVRPHLGGRVSTLSTLCRDQSCPATLHR
jgi:hypothetical protein